MKTVKKGALEYLTAENITVPHCFTTQPGGEAMGYGDIFGSQVFQRALFHSFHSSFPLNASP